MREDAIARGEDVSEEEVQEVDEDPGILPSGGNAAVLTHV